MKHVLSLLIATFAFASLQAMTVNFAVNNSVPLTYEDGTTVSSSESLRVVLVTGTLTDASTIPFTVDTAGQLVVTTSDSVTASWATITIGTTEDSVESLPLTSTGEIDDSSVLSTTSSASSVYCYLVLFDSRAYAIDGTTTASGLPVANVAIAPVGYADDAGAASKLSPFPVIMPVQVQIGSNSTSDAIANFPGMDTCSNAPASSWQAASAITSLTVDGVTYDDATTPTLTEYLTPAISGMTQNEDGSFSVTVLAPDATFYSLETTTSLTGTWVTFDNFENSLDSNAKMYYSRLRLNDEGSSISITLPVISGETSRFYRFSSGD